LSGIAPIGKYVDQSAAALHLLGGRENPSMSVEVQTSRFGEGPRYRDISIQHSRHSFDTLGDIYCVPDDSEFKQVCFSDNSNECISIVNTDPDGDRGLPDG
tara:strand:- start:61 stop:363 length:303 start_codon:yes stop_codon:yes gene_type:complete